MKYVAFTLHAVFLAAIALLAGFIIREKMRDFDPWLPQTAASKFMMATAEMQKTNRSLAREVELNTTFYTTERSIDYLKQAQKFRAMADSLRQLVDSLSNHYDATFMVQTKRKIQDYRLASNSLISKQRSLSDSLPAFDQFDEPFLESIHTADEFTPAYQALLLSQMRAEIAYHERNALMLCLVLTSSCCWEKGDIRVNFSCPQLTPKVGDTLQADVFLGKYLREESVHLKYFLNGKPLALSEKGKPIVEQVFDAPGTYPLTFTIQTTDLETDSIERYERRYFLDVDR